MLVKRSFRYLRECGKLLSESPATFSLVDLAWHFPAWYRSLQPGRNPVADQVPWLTLATIRHLNRFLNSAMSVFEYGAGGSTLFFAHRVREVISVEHDAAWGTRVQEALDRLGCRNAQVRIVLPVEQGDGVGGDPADMNAYASADANYVGWSFKNYASGIDEFPDRYFDLILIDGRARPACFKHALPKLALNGQLVWDNSDREYYSQALQSIPSHFWRKDFSGPTPYLDRFVRTTVLGSMARA